MALITEVPVGRLVVRAGEVQRASDYAEVWFALWVPVERGREEEAAAAAAAVTARPATEVFWYPFR